MTHIPGVFPGEARRWGQDLPGGGRGRSRRLRRRDALKQGRDRERDGAGPKALSRGGEAWRGFHQNTRRLHGCDVRSGNERLRLRFPPASSAPNPSEIAGNDWSSARLDPGTGCATIVVILIKCNHSLRLHAKLVQTYELAE